MSNFAAMLSNAKAQRETFLRLAADANERINSPALVKVYNTSVSRLNAIIELTQLQLFEQSKAEICLKHRRYKPCMDCFREQRPQQ